MDHLKMFSWAERHLESVEASAEQFMREKPYISACSPDLKTWKGSSMEWVFTTWLRHPIARPSEDVPFLIGDTLHALRVALDYLAVHVVLKAVPTANESKVAFPIFTKESDFKAMKGRRIPGVSGRLLDAFRLTQPFVGRHRRRAERHPLAILDALEQPHKHRRMLSALPGPYDFTHRIMRGDPRHATCLSVTIPNGPIGEDERAEIARFRIAVDAKRNPKSPVEGKIRYFVCFDRHGPAHGAPAITQLKEIRDHIRDKVFPAFEKFV